jgi:Immunity protein 53
MADELKRLQDWYFSQCNGDWEHTYGVKVENIDNPGWMLTVELTDSDLQDVQFQTQRVQRSDTDWIHCAVNEMKFRGSGGSHNLTEIIGVFLSFAESGQTKGN